MMNVGSHLSAEENQQNVFAIGSRLQRYVVQVFTRDRIRIELQSITKTLRPGNVSSARVVLAIAALVGLGYI